MLALTGLAYAFTTQINDVLCGDKLYVEAQTGSHFSSESLTVYVDPYTGGVNGELVTVDNRPPAQVWLREFHGNLHLGDLGRLYSEFVASWLPFIVLGGLVLWLSKRARGRSLRTVLVPSFAAKGRARNRSWHGVLGLWLAVGLLGISITGLQGELTLVPPHAAEGSWCFSRRVPWAGRCRSSASPSSHSSSSTAS